jgi:hypothetical protein
VPKVHNKQIKRPRKGSNKKSKSLSKCALVWRTGLSDVPPDSVRCTREPHSELATFENSGSHSAIIHQTVRCSTGLSGVAPNCPVCQRSNDYTAPTVVCNGKVKRYSARLRAQKSEQAPEGAPDCPVAQKSKLQRSNPNGRVTWLAHRTVRCAIRQQPPPTVLLVVGAINTPQPPHFNASKFSAIKPHTRAIDFIQRHNQRDQILSQVRNHSKEISD